jgi:predicted glycosyltransferase
VEKKHISKCSCSWFGEAEGGTKIVNYFCPQCRTGKYLVSVGNYYRVADVDAMLADVRRLVESAKTARTFLRQFGNHKLADRVDMQIAAVERHFDTTGHPRSSPQPEGNGKA